MAEVDVARLRRVAELAVQLIKASRPPSTAPEAVLLRLPSGPGLTQSHVRRVCAVLETNAALRERVRAAATVDMVGEDAYAWLTDPSQVGGSDRRRVAAEQARDRAEVERDHWQRQVQSLEHSMADRDARLEVALAAVEQWRQRAEAEQARAERLERSREALRAELSRQETAWKQARGRLEHQLAEVSRVRDGLMAQRVELEERVADLAADLAGQQRERRSQRPALPPQRLPLGIPGGLLADSVAAAEHLIGRTEVTVIVDGYNAVLDPWTEGHLSQRRAVLLSALENLVIRRGPSVLVVFDGADEHAGTGQRRFVRVVFTPSDKTADDVVCLEVERLPVTTPVVVVTDDQDLIKRVRRRGANTVGVEQLWGVLRA